jgi:hypothetical protein
LAASAGRHAGKVEASKARKREKVIATNPFILIAAPPLLGQFLVDITPATGKR